MDTDPRVSELLLRWQELRQQGQIVTAGELCADCPELAGELQRCMETVDHWEQFLDTSDEEEAPESVPASFGKYRLVRALGGGGQASTLLAWDPDLHCHIVLKLYHNARTPEEQDKVLSEGRALARVRSAHVARCLGVERQDGVPALVVEYVPGRNLRQEHRARPLRIGQALELMGQLAEGLAAVHACGLLHRDLKPDNVLVGDDGRPRLVDFGLAAPLASADLAGVSGTLPYMAPEQARGEAERIDARTDVYGLGAVLYQLLTGRPPHQGATQEELWQAARAGDVVPPRQLNRRVPGAVNELCLRCLAKDPTQRFASAAELASAVHRLQGWYRLRWPLATVAVLLATALGVGYTLWRGPHTDTTAPVGSSAMVRPETAEPLRVGPLEVLHLEKFDDKKSRPRRVLGTDSFGASPDDDIKVTARLSWPAYCYLIVFRPDGKGEVLYPASDQEAPERTDAPRYPSRDRDQVYGLEEGTGLWLVALVASEKPLPAYAEWRRRHPGGPWAKSEGEANVVWRDDGQWLDELTPSRRNHGERGRKKEARAAPIKQVVDWLKAETGGAVAAVAFTVEAKK
jgi:serine/threonine protein kinase